MLPVCRVRGKNVSRTEEAQQEIAPRKMGKSGMRCTVCSSKHRHAIEIGLTYHTPLRVLARRFACSVDALHRHKRNHLTESIKAAILVGGKPREIDLETLQRQEQEGALSQLVLQRVRLQQYGEQAFALGDVKAAISAEAAITGNLALSAKLTGAAAPTRYETTHRIALSPEWPRVLSLFMKGLEREGVPLKARLAIAADFAAFDQETAKDITEAKRPAVRLIEHDPEPTA
jgi:hypothetical protein